MKHSVKRDTAKKNVVENDNEGIWCSRGVRERPRLDKYKGGIREIRTQCRGKKRDRDPSVR